MATKLRKPVSRAKPHSRAAMSQLRPQPNWQQQVGARLAAFEWARGVVVDAAAVRRKVMALLRHCVTYQAGLLAAGKGADRRDRLTALSKACEQLHDQLAAVDGGTATAVMAPRPEQQEAPASEPDAQAARIDVANHDNIDMLLGDVTRLQAWRDHEALLGLLQRAAAGYAAEAAKVEVARNGRGRREDPLVLAAGGLQAIWTEVNNAPATRSANRGGALLFCQQLLAEPLQLSEAAIYHAFGEALEERAAKGKTTIRRRTRQRAA